MNSSYNYLIISEQRLFTDALKMHLSRNVDDVNVVQANNSGAASELSQQINSGIAILDCDIPPDGPFEVAARIRSVNRELKMILLLDSLSPLMIHQAIKLGIKNIFLKNNGIRNFILALDDIANEKSYLSPQIREKLRFDDKKNRKILRIDSGFQALSKREIEVLRYLSRGYSVKEVSNKMHLSPKSIDSHKYRIMSKLNIHDRVHLSRFCIREGLIQP